MAEHREDLVARFTELTGANPSVAQGALQSTDWNIDQAVDLYFTSRDDDASQAPFDDDEPEDPIAPAPPGSTGTYGAGASSSNPARPAGAAASRPKAMTLRDLQRGGDDDEDDEDEKPQDMFAGGEKSGLAVQNPGNGPVDHFRNIMNQARQNHDRPPAPDDDESEPRRQNNFIGRAQTLGGDDAPSRVLEDPRARGSQRQHLSRVTRTLHLWADGVSIDDGPLLRFDDPANEHIMHEINQGRAPKALLDVQPGQEVDLNLEPHKGENYVAPKQKYKPFGGQGQRLGAPTPGLSTETAASSSAPTAPATTTATASAPTQQVSVDESQPTLQLQIRLGDGSRLASRFNTTHTIGDVYEFVNRASAASTQRPYALMTTFPSRELSDKSQVLGEMSDFKRGGVVVQKWT